MKTVDKVAAVLLAVLGLIHSLLTGAYVHGQHKEPADGAWFLGSGVALIAVGLLNFVRASRPGDRLIRISCLLSNIFAVIFCVAVFHLLGSHIMEAPQAILVAALVVVELVFSAVPNR
jgi:hypothetical protein